MTFIPGKGFEDAFGKLIADSTTLEGEVHADQPYSPERLRVSYDTGSTGSFVRRFIQYGDSANFTDLGDGFELAPGNGDTMKLETAETFRYVVQSVLLPSFAFQLNQALATGDKATIAYGDADLNNDMVSADGWIIELKPSLGTHEAHYNMYRSGTIVSNGGSDKLVTFEKAHDIFSRFGMFLNWYNVGNSELQETFTKDGEQFNEIGPKKISADDQKGPTSANRKLQFALKSGGNGTTLEVGSMAVVILSDHNPGSRDKGITRQWSLSGTGNWEPLAAFRLDPNRDDITSQIDDISILDFNTTSLLEINLQAFDETKVSFGTGAWDTPEGLNDQNTAFEEREDVQEYALETGVLTTDGTDIGGFQLGHDAFITTASGEGGNRSTSKAGGKQRTTDRPLYDKNVVVVLGRTSNSGEATVGLILSHIW